MIGLKNRIAAYESTAKLHVERLMDREAPVTYTSVKKRISFFESEDSTEPLNTVPESDLRKADADKYDVEAHLPSDDCSSFVTARSRFENSGQGGTDVKVQPNVIDREVTNSSVKELISFFESKIPTEALPRTNFPRAGMDEEHVENSEEGGTDVKVQPNVIDREVTNSSVKELISFFESKIPTEALPRTDFPKAGLDEEHVDVHFPFDECNSFETAPSRFEEDSFAKLRFCDDDLNGEIINRIEDGSGTECEIQPNVNPTPSMSLEGSREKSNPFIFHINAPATNISEARKVKSKSLRRRKKTVARGMVLKGLANFKDKAAKRKEKKEGINVFERTGLVSRENVEKAEGAEQLVPPHFSPSETPAQKRRKRFQFFPRMNNVEGQQRHGPRSSMLSSFLSHRSRKGRAQQTDNDQTPAIEMEMSVSPGDVKKAHVSVGNILLTISVSATKEGE